MKSPASFFSIGSSVQNNIVRRITARDGIEIAAEALGVGPPLAFAHGLTSHRRISRLQFEALADRYRVILYDQRGHGESAPVTDPALYGVVRMGDDMRAVLDAFGIERATVGGESMGAATALAFALAHPERVERLLLTAPAFGDADNAGRDRLLEMADEIERWGMPEFLELVARRQREQFNWGPDLIAFVASMIGAHQPASIAAALKAVSAWRPFSDLSVLARLRCPVFILAWDHDPLHPLELARRMAAHLPNARLHQMEPPPALFRDPPLVGRLYREFLETI